MKALIMETDGRYAAALREDGEVVRVLRGDREIGQEIELENAAASSVSGRIKKAASVAAAAVILLAAGSAAAYAMPYGTVSVEGETTLEYTINCFDRVLDVKTLGADLDVSDLLHKEIGDAGLTAVEELDRTREETGETQALVITAETRSGKHTQSLQASLDRIAETQEMRAEDTEPREEIPEEEVLPETETLTDGIPEPEAAADERPAQPDEETGRKGPEGTENAPVRGEKPLQAPVDPDFTEPEGGMTDEAVPEQAPQAPEPVPEVG